MCVRACACDCDVFVGVLCGLVASCDCDALEFTCRDLLLLLLDRVLTCSDCVSSCMVGVGVMLLSVLVLVVGRWLRRLRFDFRQRRRNVPAGHERNSSVALKIRSENWPFNIHIYTRANCLLPELFSRPIIGNSEKRMLARTNCALKEPWIMGIEQS